MTLETTYLGFTLANPIIVGASPISHDVDWARRCVDAGASAIVMYSLFEEQIVREQMAMNRALEEPSEAFAEAIRYFPEPEQLDLGPKRYLEQIRLLKEAVDVPVIASLNGTSQGGWLRYAALIEAAGADAIELNTYNLVTDPRLSSVSVEAQTLQLVNHLHSSLKIPLSVKLSSFYTALPHFAANLTDAGAAGLVLFNRFLQPDIDPERLEVTRLQLSDSSELTLRLHWLAILFGQIGNSSLAVSGGVHTALDIVKATMAGASATQMVSALLRNAPGYLKGVLADLGDWLEEHEFESLRQMQGNMSLLRCPNPGEYVRDNYMQVLQSWTA